MSIVIICFCKGKIAEASHKMTIYQERGIAEKLQKQTDVETDIFHACQLLQELLSLQSQECSQLVPFCIFHPHKEVNQIRIARKTR